MFSKIFTVYYLYCLLVLLVCANPAVAGPNANATVSLDLIVDGGAGNQMDDGVTSGTVSGQGTKIAVEVFTKGVTTPLQAVVIKFDFDASVLKVEKVENSAFSAILDGQGATFLTVSPVTLPQSGFLARAEFSTVTDVTGQAFTLGIATISLQENSTSKDDVTTTNKISFNANNTDPSADFDGNGVVGVPDFLLFVDHFGTSRGGASYDAKYDLDGNGTIGVSDFLIFVDSFGKAVPPSGGGGSGGGGSSNTYGVGESLPNFPSGFFAPAQASQASFQFSQGRAVLGFQNGGLIKLNDGTTYTCIASGGCDVEGGRVTAGTIRVTTGSSGGGSGGGSGGSGGGSGGGNSGSPDLVVESPSVSDSSPDAGEYFTLSATVRNQGNGSGTYVLTTLRYYQSTDATISTSDTKVGSDLVSRLAAGETSDESDRVRAPSSPGTYYYGACVESVGGESNTNNNCSDAVTVTVGSPDLVVESPSVSDSSPDAGEYFTLSATVRNQGNGSGTYVLTTLRYYQSTDATISTSDTKVGSDLVSRLAAGETSDESDRVRAPSSPGTYYYGACIESASGESNTNNNCSTGVRVTVSSSGGGSGGGSGGTPPPSGDAVTGSVTDCSSRYDGFIYNLLIKGTVRASRPVSNVLLDGYIGSSFVGITSLGSMSAGQSKNFTITGISGSEPSGRCRVEMTWLEGGNKSQGVVDEQ